METSEHHESATTFPSPAILRGSSPSVLARLYDPGVMLVTTEASPDPDALRHVESLLARGPRESTVRVHTPDGVPDLGSLEGLVEGSDEHGKAWVSYVGGVTGTFADLVGAETVGIRQLVADGPHCARFHVDKVLARAVLNVRGACTEWLPDSDVDRSRLGHAGGPDDGASGLVRCWDRLDRAETGSLTVFKGTAWPGAADRAVVHRSPPKDGQRRVLLTLDWLD